MSGSIQFTALLLMLGGYLGASYADTRLITLPSLLAGSIPPPVPSPQSADDPSEKSKFAVPTRSDRAGRIIAPVMINGLGPFRFMVDTGSNRTVLAQSTLAQLGMKAEANATVAVTGITGSELAQSVHLRALDAGDLHFREIDVPVLAGPVFNGLDGILGMDGFDGMKVFADFDQDRLTISQSRGTRPAYSFSVMHVEFLSGRLLMVDAKVGRVAVKAIIDTGSQHSLGNAALLEAVKHPGRDDASRDQAGVIDVTQVSKEATVGHVHQITIGEVQIQNLGIVFGDFHIFKTWGLQDEPALLIGMDVLGAIKALDIDYRRKEVALLPRLPTRTFIVAKPF